MPKRILSGKVVKKSGDKTVSVLVTRQTTHPIYKKIMRVSKKYLAHDADNAISIGDNVKIAAKSGIMRNIDSNTDVGGYPAQPIRNWHKSTAFLMKNVRKK